ncbi:hypothetical protein AVEN_105196-1, partial [Araneus ventricosus]
RSRRIPGFKPDSTEDPPFMSAVARKIIPNGQMSSRWRGAQCWRGGASLGVVLFS